MFCKVFKKIYKMISMLIGSIVILTGVLGIGFAGYILVGEEIQKNKTRRQRKND